MAASHPPRSGAWLGFKAADPDVIVGWNVTAAVGRCLAGAKTHGRWKPVQDVHVYAFRAQPDGEPRDVLVIYAERDVDWDGRGVMTSDWQPPAHIEILEIIDYLGRSLGTSFAAPLTSAPIFVLLPEGQAERLPLETPPARAGRRDGDPSPVVLQLSLPRSTVIPVHDLPWSEAHADCQNLRSDPKRTTYL